MNELFTQEFLFEESYLKVIISRNVSGHNVEMYGCLEIPRILHTSRHSYDDKGHQFKVKCINHQFCVEMEK